VFGTLVIKPEGSGQNNWTMVSPIPWCQMVTQAGPHGNGISACEESGASRLHRETLRRRNAGPAALNFAVRRSGCWRSRQSCAQQNWRVIDTARTFIAGW